MSHLLTKKGDKYKVWTTISDGYLMDRWLTEAELRSWIAKQAERKYKQKLIEDLWMFPHGWHTKERQVLWADDIAREACYDWVMKLCRSKTEEEYDATLDAKFKELTADLPDFYSF